MNRLADFRQVFAEVVTSVAGCQGNASLARAFATVPRHEFLAEGPWIVSEDGAKTPSADAAVVYHDWGLALADGIPTGLPSLHAECINACSIRPGEHVIHVGAGTGYFTAILAELVGESGAVTAFEIEDSLSARARANLQRWPWVRVASESAITASLDPADLIYVNAGVQTLPRPWLDALRPGGRLLLPLVPGSGEGVVLLVARTESPACAARFVRPARFVPCIGAEDEEQAGRLADTLRTRDPASIRSLRLSPEKPDESAWFVADEWWLSSAAP